MQKKKGTFVGLSTLDALYAIPGFPKPNSKNVATKQEISAGGPATNAAITFAYLGGRSTLITAIGRHPIGSIMRHDLFGHGVHLVDLVPDFDEAPTLSSIMVTEETGDRIVVSANATRFPALPQTFDLSPIDGSSVVLVDGHHMTTCIASARYARSKGICVVLDGGSWKSGMEQLLNSIDIAICSQDFSPPDCPGKCRVIDYVFRKGVSEIAITRGEKSILFATQSESGELPVRRIRAIDTLGAGDVFHGAFCYAYRSKDVPDFRTALEFASKIATRSCEHFGTRAWMGV